MQNVTGGTSPLPAFRPPAPPEVPCAAAAIDVGQAIGEAIGEDIATLEPRRDGGIATGAASSGARPSSLSLPGLGRPRTAEPDLAPEDAAGGASTMELDISNGVYDGGAGYIETGSTSTGTSRGSTGSRGKRSV